MRVRKNVADKAFTETTQEPTFYEWLLKKLDTAFVENIPVESMKELPTNYMYIFGVFAYVASFTCFLFFAYTGYHQMTSKKFITPNIHDGDCEAVLRAVDAVYLGDRLGMWSGDNLFQYSNALYQINLRKFKENKKNYREKMQAVGYELDLIGQSAFDRNLAENIAYWVAWQHKLPGTSSTFHMLGSPTIIFDRQLRFGLLANVNGECLVTRQTTFDRANSYFELTYDVSKFKADPICSSIAVPEALGYNEAYDSNSFTLKLDVRSFVTSFAVNSHILDIKELEVVTGSELYYNISGLIFKKTERFFGRYPGHSPMECLELSNASVCGLQFGSTFGIPVFNHYGTGEDHPENCDCSSGHVDKYYCHVFDFMLGMLFYNVPFGDDSSRLSDLALLDLAFRYPEYEALNQAAYNSSYAASSYGEYTDPAWREGIFKFCESSISSNLSCSLLLFNTYDELSTITTDYYYPVNKGACNNSFTISDWDDLVETPPTDLIQEYYVCTNSRTDALFSSVGIAAGNAATFVPLLLLGVLPFIYLYLQTSGKLPPKDEYSKQELATASEALALTILRIRDGKIRGVDADGILRKLTNELVKAAKSEGGYPDSDDDSDDESEQPETKRTSQHAVQPHVQLKSSVFIKKKRGSAVSIPEEKSPFWDLFGAEKKRDSAVELQAPRRTSQPRSDREITVLNSIDFPGKRTISVEKITTLENAMKLMQAIKSAMEKAHSVRDKDGAGAVHRQAQFKTSELKNIDPRQAFPSPETARMFFLQLYNVIIMDASLSLSCSMPEVSYLHSTKVGYQVGDRVLTASDIFRMANSDDNELSEDMVV